MECFKCNNDSPNPAELCGVDGQNEFLCFQCGYLETCKRMYLENLPDAINVNNSGTSEDFEMFFETAKGFFVSSNCIDDIIVEVETAECETMTEVQTAGGETTTVGQTARHDVDLHGITVESDQLKLKSILASWGVSPLYKNVTACGINCTNMYYQGSRDLEIVLGDDKHLLGYMIKFRHLLRQRNTPGDNTSEVQTTEVETTTEVLTGEDEAGAMTIESDQLELKSLLVSWGVGVLYKNLTECGINCGNMPYLESRDLEIILGNDRHLLGYMITFMHLLGQWSTDSTSNRSDTINVKPTVVDVLNILNHSVEGKRFISDYKKHIPCDALRYTLVSIILKETFSKARSLPKTTKSPANRYLVLEVLEHAQLQIVGQIGLNDTNNEPEEDQEECNEVQTNNESEADQEECNGLLPHEIETCEVNSHESDQCSTDNVETSLKLIKDNTADCNKDLLLEHWKKTFEHRQEEMSKYEDIDEVFANWPPLKRERGHALLCIDFLLKYGVEASNGLNNWNSFFDRNLTTISETVRDPLMKRTLNALDSSTNLETKNKIIIMALHHLLVPSTTVVNGAKWKPTVPMSQESFLKTVNGHIVMISNMTKRDNFCKRYGMKNHPVIFEITTCMGIRYYVCIKDVSYKVQSLIEGVDVAYKIFKTLNIDFPLECRKVWTFIEYIFYGEGVNISGRLLSIISDLNKN